MLDPFSLTYLKDPSTSPATVHCNPQNAIIMQYNPCKIVSYIMHHNCYHTNLWNFLHPNIAKDIIYSISELIKFWIIRATFAFMIHKNTYMGAYTYASSYEVIWQSCMRKIHLYYNCYVNYGNLKLVNKCLLQRVLFLINMWC